MYEREIPYFGYQKETQDKIMNVAIRLFANNGYGATSVKDIADGVGIKPGSIYNYYKGKEDIFNAAMERFEKEYKSYFSWLREMNSHATTLEEVLDNMFMELLKVRDLSVYYGVSLLRQEQFVYEGARERVFRLLYVDTIDWLQEAFERLIEKGVIPQCNTKLIATTLMWCVMGSVDVRIHISNGFEPPLDINQMFKDVKIFLLQTLYKESNA